MPSATQNWISAQCLRTVLNEYSSKLGIDSAAIVLAEDTETASTLTRWVTDTHRDLPYSITIPSLKSEHGSDGGQHPPTAVKLAHEIEDGSFTHTLAQVGGMDANDISAVLQRQFYALQYKGIAVMTVVEVDPVAGILTSVLSGSRRGDVSQTEGKGRDTTLSESDLVDLAERAQFERGKVRWSKCCFSIQDDGVTRLILQLEKDVENALGPCELGQGWRTRLQEELQQRLDLEGRLQLEYWLMLAMKWDMLTG